MTLLNLAGNSTPRGNATLNSQINSTHAGMAHFAGTCEAAGKTCRECSYFSAGRVADYYAKSSSHGSTLKPARCGKFTLMTGKQGNAIPHTARACKYFEQADAPPPIRNPRA